MPSPPPHKTLWVRNAIAVATLSIALPNLLTAQVSNAYAEWNTYRGDQKGNQYTELAQIHTANVHRLELTWQYRTGDANARSSPGQSDHCGRIALHINAQLTSRRAQCDY